MTANYIIQSTKMNQVLIVEEIVKSMNQLLNLNQMLYDYWIDELYDGEVSRRIENWTEENLNELRIDIWNAKYTKLCQNQFL